MNAPRRPRARLDLSVEEARGRLLSLIDPLESEQTDLVDALGSVLFADVLAPFDLPRFANSAMDGYAVRSSDLADPETRGSRDMDVAGNVDAGQAWPNELPARSAIRIGTGGAIPHGADAVIPSELVDVTGSAIRPTIDITPGTNIRQQGEDIRAGSIAVAGGVELRPQEIGLLAALGVERVSAVRGPRVSILSIGPELIAGAQPAPVPDANGPMLAALAARAGAATVHREQVAGEAPELIETLRRLAAESDLILTSGAISDGPADTLRQVLAELPDIELWNLRLRPGKHYAAGMLEHTAIISLPGNPIAALVGFVLIAEIAIARLSGRSSTRSAISAIAVQPIPGSRGRTDAVRADARFNPNGGITVSPIENRGSAVLSTLRDANCLALVPENRDLIEPGEAVEIRWIGVSMTEFGKSRFDD